MASLRLPAQLVTHGTLNHHNSSSSSAVLKNPSRRLTLIALRNEKINGKLLTFAGPRAWTTQEVLSSDTVFSVPMTETNNLLGVDQKDLVTLEKYLQDYFSNILKKLKDLKAQSKQSDIYF